LIKSYKQITGKYLKTNKKRTVLTIVGIILSVALISSIGLFLKGIQEEQIDYAKENYGSYHLAFTKVTDDIISKIINNPKVARSGLIAKGQTVKFGEKLSTDEILATDRALELLPYKPREGRLPKNNSEIAIEKWVLRYIDKDAKLGSKINIKGKEYTLVGILEDGIKSQMDQSGVILTKDNNINKENAILLIEIGKKTNLKEAVKEFKRFGTDKTIQENKYLLTAQGAYDDGSNIAGLFIAVGVIIGIVVIATISVIYNSFQISIVERMRQFGLLRAVGSTPKQIRKIVLREATILAAIGIPIGLLCGIIATYGINIAFKLIGGDSVKFTKVVISTSILGISALVGLVSVYISALIPAFFAGRISPLMAISSRTAIKKEKIKRTKNTIIKKLFGFEGALAVKNIKRNKKRYRITVFSIVISVMLLVAFKSFTDMSLKISTSTNESTKVNYSIVIQNDTGDIKSPIDENLIKDIKSLNTVQKVYNVYGRYNYFQAAIDSDKKVNEVKDIGAIYKDISYNKKSMTRINSSIASYDNNALEDSKKYLDSGEIDINKLNSENGVILINKNKFYNDKTKKTYVGPVADFKVGDEILLQNSDSSNASVEFGKGKINKVKVLAVLKEDPFDFYGDPAVLKLITTEDVAKKISGKEAVKLTGLDIVIKNIKDEESVNKQLDNIIKPYPSLTVINKIDKNRSQNSAVLMVQILLYGFVIVVSLISSVNIINTLTTNIILRRREFATLKSIGLTQRGLKKIIVLEGLLYGIIGAIYGSIIGCGLSYVLFRGLSGVREFGWGIPWNAIIIASICAIAIGYLSVLSPLSRVNKDNLIDTIREES
jgi:putative ABC transport system permease protein